MKFVEDILDDCIVADMIKQDEYDLYYYCFYIFFSKIFFSSIIVLFAILSNQFPVTIAYYIGFLAIRYTSGGYHANSPKMCLLLSISVYLVCLKVIHLVPIVMYPEIMFLTLLLTISLIIRFAPVDHPNKRFSAQEKYDYQKKSRKAIMISMLMVIVFWKIQPLYSWAITVGCLTAAFFVTIAAQH